MAASKEQAQSGRHEQRQAPRRNVNTTGWIRLDGSFATCKILDVSTVGVRLVIPSATKIPEAFTLFFSKRAQGHQVRVIWRDANQIGAKFI
jgi:PilZ domain